jgi:hypothetical protein
VPPLVRIRSEELKKVLEADGFKVRHEDQFHWYMSRGLTDIPLCLPKQSGEAGWLAREVLDNILIEAHIDEAKLMALYFMVFGGNPYPN